MPTVPMKLQYKRYKIPTVAWQHWGHKHKSKAVKVTVEEILAEEAKRRVETPKAKN